LERARDLFGDALSAHRLVGNRGEEGVVLGNLGQLHREMGDLETARLRLLEALQIARDLRDEGRQKRLQQALDNLDG